METAQILTVVQTISILIGIGFVVMKFGKREQQLQDNTDSIRQLRSLSHDLLKILTQASTNVEHHSASLEELKRRIERLEVRNARADTVNRP
jgi:hypothetical protein